MVTSTKSGLQRPWVEFVLGVGMIIKGVDRAILRMSLGERSKIRVTPTYAYGISPLPPCLFVQAPLVFPLTFLLTRKCSLTSPYWDFEEELYGLSQ